MAEFVQLHNHSDYSLLDGMLRISENHKPSKFLQGLVKQGIKAMGLTDHGNMYGSLAFYNTCKKVGIKPIIGTEFYVFNDLRVKSNKKEDKIDESLFEPDW